MPHFKVYRTRSQHETFTPEQVEQRISDACKALSTGTSKNILAASREFSIEKYYHTLRRRWKGESLPRKDAHDNQRLLNDAQEKVLVDWIKFLGVTGRPICMDTIRPYIYDLCGQYPGPKWIYKFKNRHSEVKKCRPARLDPKHVQAFNYLVVKDHFEKLEAILKKEGECF